MPAMEPMRDERPAYDMAEPRKVSYEPAGEGLRQRRYEPEPGDTLTTDTDIYADRGAQTVELHIQRIGIYGWRKYCLYCSVLWLVILALINFGLVLWLIDAFELSDNRAGPVVFREHRIRIEGDVEFTQGLVAPNLTALTGTTMQLESTEGVNLRAGDTSSSGGGSTVSLGTDAVQVTSGSLRGAYGDDIYLTANASQVTLRANEVVVESASGLLVSGTLQTGRLENAYTANQGLTVESVGQDLSVQANQDVTVNSQTASVTVSAFDSISLTAANELSLSGNAIVMDNLPVLAADAGAAAFQLCACASGQLYRVASGAACATGVSLC
ncbi:uncharacterized protein MONBRDRAFT_6251 [Monosiga brevicollis MX1]|uniref:Uncharacterized protein n=1 Tax=Monosiga brevicollis TaxID=81824 RepID=A9UT99_MONBE|nr:uncharacterized protein MONBRDRAFT_6251 [Monosiga brevicollis MX1]EDQ91456.1 predicted protein [Monosiga brevicollis MX1]|eukprot:XP_001743878.1 hypothetical protein [Monosiga brevicollis MX1]